MKPKRIEVTYDMIKNFVVPRNEFLSLKDYEYVFVYKKDNKWYYMIKKLRKKS